MRIKLLLLMNLLIWLTMCSKNATSPDQKEVTPLSNTEQMQIISAEVAASSGGIMADIGMMGMIAKGGFATGLQKPASFDTTFTYGWITYSVSLSFFNAQGSELPFYIPKFTDKIIYQGTLTGHDSTGNREIDLNKTASFVVTGITTGVITINGSASNNSTYEFSGNEISSEAEVHSSFVVTDVVINTEVDPFIPQSGKIECSFKGHYHRSGPIQDKDVEYDFTVTLEFTGGNQVKVTLPNGDQYTLDLVTGEYTTKP